MEPRLWDELPYLPGEYACVTKDGGRALLRMNDDHSWVSVGNGGWLMRQYEHMMKFYVRFYGPLPLGDTDE